MKICDFGCGLEGKYFMKSSKKYCCSNHPNSCLGKRNKDSKLKKGINPFIGKKHPRGFSGKIPWNKGLQNNPLCRKDSLIGNIFGSNLNGHTQQTKEKLSKIAQAKGLGGYIHNSGRGKKGKYKGFYFDSSWELAWIVYMLDHNIPFKRNYSKFLYIHDNIERYYIPDFILEDGVYVEIKGYKNKQWEDKIKYFPFLIKVLDKDEITMYIEYAKEQYGKDFVNILNEK